MIEDLPVLHLKGSEYEMGKQYGFLAGDRIASNVLNLKEIGQAEEPKIKLLPDALFTYLRRIVGWVFWLTFPKNIKDHIKGIVSGAKENKIKLNRFDIAFINSIIDLVGIAKSNQGEVLLLKILGLEKFNYNCDSMAVWGNRTMDGKTFQTRNTDITTGTGIERFPIVVIYKPQGKIPFITAAFSGMVGIFSGMNAYGVSLGQVWAFSKDVKLATPWNLVMRKYFSNFKTAKEVEGALRKRGTTTYGNNFVIADAGGHENSNETGYAIEMTAKRYASFSANDQKELLATYQEIPYGYPIENAVFRGDLSLDLDIRSRQLASNGPDGDPRTTSAYSERYKGQYDRILAFEQNGVLISHVQAESISRETAMRDSSLQTSVYANTDRDFWVSYSKINDDGSVIQAYQRNYINIPFYKYLVNLQFSNGKVEIKNWFKQRELKLIHKSRNNTILIENQVIVSDEKIYSTGIVLLEGESLELYQDNQLIDRLQKN
jgi:hypothetical protein